MENPTGSATVRITFTIAGQAVALRVGSAIYHLYNDHLGSTAVLGTSGAGVVSGSRAYYLPFGSYRGTAPTQTLTDRQFTGQQENLEVGLYYYNARFYVPSIGRFASADTLVPDPQNPQQYNRYTYSLNNPLSFTDPTGHIACNNSHLPGEDQQACVATTEPIWTHSFIDNPDWVQYYGPTEFAEETYSSGVHSGLDMGRFAQTFGSTGWNPRTEWYDFDGTYGTESRPLIPVYAGCSCTVDSIPETTGHYAPGRVKLRSTNETYQNWLLIYGHLMDIQVSSGQSVTPDTIIGYLETTEIHVHAEIRKPDNSYTNPFPYLSRDLQVEMLSFQGDSSGTRYRPRFSSDPYYQKPGRY